MDNSSTTVIMLLENLRADVNKNNSHQDLRHSELMSEVAVLKNQMKDLVGNGKVGRISILEQTVAALNKTKTQAMLIASAVAAVVSAGLVGLAEALFYKHF